MRVAAANVDVAGVVPGLRGVGEQVDGADESAERAGGAAGGRRRRNGNAGGQAGGFYQFKNLERAARAEGARGWGRVVNEVGAPEENSPLPPISPFRNRFPAHAL